MQLVGCLCLVLSKGIGRESCDDGMEMFQGQLLSANFSDVSSAHLGGNLFIS